MYAQAGALPPSVNEMEDDHGVPASQALSANEANASQGMGSSFEQEGLLSIQAETPAGGILCSRGLFAMDEIGILKSFSPAAHRRCLATRTSGRCSLAG